MDRIVAKVEPVLRFADRLLPFDLLEPEARYRGRILVCCLITVLPFSMVGALIAFAQFGFTGVTPFHVARCVVVLCTPLVLLATRSVRISAYFVVLSGIVLTSFATRGGPGIIAPILVWRPIVPILMGAIAGRRAAVAVALIVIGDLSSLWWVERFDGPEPRLFLVVTCLAVVFSTVLVITYETVLKATLTRMMAVQDELRLARDEARAADRAKADFLAMMSHELRTPLTGTLDGIQVALESGLDARPQEALRVANSSGETLRALIERILDFSEMESGELELDSAVFDVRRLVDDTVDVLRPFAERKNLVVDVEVEDAVPNLAETDAVRVRQVLTNLISNAVTFTDAGRVHVTVSADELKDNDVVLRFAVEDTGPGLQAGAAEGLFQAFEQADGSTSRRHQGAGLGLAISRSVAELLGGDIGVESRPGEGSTFWFTTPCAVPEISTDRLRDSIPPGAPVLLKGRVLLADDTEANRKVFGLMLEMRGLEVGFASNGEEAVTEVLAGEYDLVLLDCRMPVLDGYGAATRIRASETGRRTPIVAVTADGSQRQRCIDAGMDDFLIKPVRPHQLFAMLDQWISSD